VRCGPGLSLELLLNKRPTSLRLAWATSYCSCFDHGPLSCQFRSSRTPCGLDRTSSRSVTIMAAAISASSNSALLFLCPCFLPQWAWQGLLQAPRALCGSHASSGALSVFVLQDHRTFVPGEKVYAIDFGVCHMAYTQQPDVHPTSFRGGSETSSMTEVKYFLAYNIPNRRNKCRGQDANGPTRNGGTCQ
jgi:hypothetical protein